MQKEVLEVIALSPKALCSPHPYDPENEVFVQLDEPLWVPRPGAKDIAMEIMSLCVQLDTILLSRNLEKQELTEEAEGGGQHRVTFGKLWSNKVTAVFKLMEEYLTRAGITEDLQTYLMNTDLAYLFPRVELYLQEPNQLLEQISTPIMDGYLSHMANLSNILTMARQLNSDVLSSPSHKYIAHETALVYQCLGNLPQFSHLRKDIESHFTSLKACCTPSSSSSNNCSPPRLSNQLQSWLVNLTETLMELTSSLSLELLTSDVHTANVIETIHNIDSTPPS